MQLPEEEWAYGVWVWVLVTCRGMGIPRESRVLASRITVETTWTGMGLWRFGLGWVKIRVWVWVTLRGMRLTRLGLDWVSVRVWVTWIGLKRFGLG